jgi:hypothetical protein
VNVVVLVVILQASPTSSSVIRLRINNRLLFLFSAPLPFPLLFPILAIDHDPIIYTDIPPLHGRASSFYLSSFLSLPSFLFRVCY